jgi:hypothetical protein
MTILNDIQYTGRAVHRLFTSTCKIPPPISAMYCNKLLINKIMFVRPSGHGKEPGNLMDAHVKYMCRPIHVRYICTKFPGS